MLALLYILFNRKLEGKLPLLISTLTFIVFQFPTKSIKRNEDGSVRVLSKFIPKTKSEITKNILYTMDINCFEKSFRDVDVFTDEGNSRLNDLADWQDPNGDKLILGVIGQVCRVEN